VREEVGILAYPIDKPKADQLYKTLRQRLGETSFDYLWHAGRLLSVEEVLGEVEAVFGPVQDPGKGPAAMLSSRELQVASLVAEGLSNRAIASRLHIGVRTVETHVENIMNKLGVHTRAEVAAWVVKQTP
jgi:non-specific serine/threonine protein kinase